MQHFCVGITVYVRSQAALHPISYQFQRVSRMGSLQSHEWGNRGSGRDAKIRVSWATKTGLQLRSSDSRSEDFPTAPHHTCRQEKVPKDQKASGTEPVSVQQIPPAKAGHAPLLSSPLASPPPQFTLSERTRQELEQFQRFTISRYFTQKEKKIVDKQQQVVTKQCFNQLLSGAGTSCL